MPSWICSDHIVKRTHEDLVYCLREKTRLISYYTFRFLRPMNRINERNNFVLITLNYSIVCNILIEHYLLHSFDVNMEVDSIVFPP